MDDVLQQGEKLIILEYVTRGFALKQDTTSFYQDQVNLYTLLLQKNGYATADYAYLLFYYPKEINWGGDVWFHKELHKMPVSVSRAEKLFQQAIVLLEGKMPLISKECQFCRWRYE